MNKTMHNERYNISAVQKALKILSLFIRNDEGYTFTRVVNESGGMNKSNVLRILTTLRNEGFLCYDEHTSYYYLGPVFINFKSAGTGNLRIYLEEDLRRAAKESGMIVHYTVCRNGELKLIFRFFPQSSFESLALASMEEGSVPLNATGAGKIYAAFADEDIRKQLMDRCRFLSYSHNTITDRNIFEETVRTVRQQGYAINNCEHEEFLCCLSRPVFSAGGHLAGALSFSGLKDMFTGERYERMDRLSRELSAELSRRFAYEG